jgi:hypothetical protein
MKQKTFNITIDLGKGVKMNAPFKKNWTIGEWRRMVAHMDNTTRNVVDLEEYK